MVGGVAHLTGLPHLKVVARAASQQKKKKKKHVDRFPLCLFTFLAIMQ